MKNTNTIFSIQQFDRYMQEENLLTFRSKFRGGIALLFADDSLASILIYLMCLKTHVPVIIVNLQESHALLKQYLHLWNPDWLFLPIVIEPEDIENYDCFQEWRGYRLLKLSDAGKKNAGTRKMLKNDLAVLLSTSGSTGTKKFVMLSRTNLRVNAESIIQSLEIQNGDRAAVLLPISYSYGLSVINSYLLAGGTLLIPGTKIFERACWDFLEEEKVQGLCGVPYSYEVYRKFKVFRRNLTHLKLMTQAGGALGENLMSYLLEEAQCRGIDFAVMYGQTEATARMSCFFLNRHPDKFGSVGKAIPGGHFNIINPDEHGIGEVVYKGDNVCLGYASCIRDLLDNQDTKDNTEDYSNRQLLTGDIGYLDAEGYLYITGRKKRFVKVNGKRISLDELQQTMTEYLNQETVCIGICNEGMEKICAFITGDLILSEVTLKAERYFPALKGRIEYRQIDQIPRTTNGKVNYFALSELV